MKNILSLMLSIMLSIMLVGCLGSSPKVYSSGDSKVDSKVDSSGDSKDCSYDKIQGKSFKYIGNPEYIHLSFIYNQNSQRYQQMNLKNYESIRINNFKILETGIITEENSQHNRKPIFKSIRYSQDNIGEHVYEYDSGFSRKVITEDCKIYYLNQYLISGYKSNIRNSDESELNDDDLTYIIGKEALKKLSFESTIEYDKFNKTTKISTPFLKNTLIRGNFLNHKELNVQLYTNLVFKHKWGFIRNAVDTDGKTHKVVQISTDTDCSKYGCTLTETIGIDLSLDFLKKHQNGFEIKAYGAEERIINVPATMVKSFLKATEEINNK